MAEGLRVHQDRPYTVAAVPQTLLDLMRGEAQAPVPDAETQSFARPARHSDANGREQVPVWTEKFEKAVAKNPCFMILR